MIPPAGAVAPGLALPESETHLGLTGTLLYDLHYDHFASKSGCVDVGVTAVCDIAQVAEVVEGKVVGDGADGGNLRHGEVEVIHRLPGRGQIRGLQIGYAIPRLLFAVMPGVAGPAAHLRGVVSHLRQS